ncbi:MAG: hypothetical protein ACREEM_40100 [Blastocatellia bacterium]
MTNAIEAITGKLKELAGGWASYTTLGSFALYVVGYLALRFHLTALGVGTDLAVLDERYLFTGAKFLVYFLSSIPLVVLAALPMALAGWLLTRLIPANVREKIGHWVSNPSRLALAGIVVAVLLIQLVMRRCFEFSNLLLADEQLDAWVWRVMLSAEESARTFFFSALVAGLVVTGGLLLAARNRAEQTARSRFLAGLLALLVVIQFLLLPVNYGVMIIDKMLPRVADLGGVERLKEGQEAWLVWEGKDGLTYLVRSADECGTGKTSRKLVTLPQKEVKKTEIIRYDPILRCIFAGRCEE